MRGLCQHIILSIKVGISIEHNAGINGRNLRVLCHKGVLYGRGQVHTGRMCKPKCIDDELDRRCTSLYGGLALAIPYVTGPATLPAPAAADRMTE